MSDVIEVGGSAVGIREGVNALANPRAAVWEDTTAALDIDFVGDRVLWNGLKFSSIDNFVKAIGGTRTGQKLTFPWTDSTVTIVAEAQTAQSASGNEVLYAIDDGTTNNFHRLRRDNPSGTLRAQTTGSGSTVADMSGAAVFRGDFIRSAHSTQPSSYRFARNGATALTGGASGSLATCTTMRIGTDLAGLDWTGVIDRITVYTTPETDATAISALSKPAWDFLTEGDSYGAGAGGVGTAASAAKSKYRPINFAVGGSSLLQARDRILAMSAGNKALPLLFWDGDANGYGVLGTDMQFYADIAAALGHSRFLIIPSAKRNDQSAPQQAATIALSNALKAAYPGNILDVMPMLISMGDPVADATDITNKNVPDSLMQDRVHLTSVAMDAVIALAVDVMRSRGWIRSIG